MPFKPTSSPPIPVPKKRAVSTHHTVSIDGRKTNDTATVGTILLGGENDRPIVSMFYVAYAEEGVREAVERAVTEERGHEQ
jgi:carboxypeptidase C (cathepsin A)